mmetsp:Transcript_18607/g.24166  ORF Transcript_18607/g.24166 Transcript_18607/m.24166 type:complete len:838 (+) Transcript_18607:85-2598(+)|eukprot:CAMPEP_0116061712 /NCGR_PEP_ID=MMETSP0322-20121206/7253_1 /TAXON_ID=163516 /ORGANISM="Leptocylindrus danicus var. apora, Strain B651" /LENGTH=837 /DNA_ID=CAMNT_0003546733 /DNA_START=2425 /DNA_END=4938 /DNA_ORIENTATION=+
MNKLLRYPKLFTPLKLHQHHPSTPKYTNQIKQHTIQLKNRIICGSMHTGLEGCSMPHPILERLVSNFQRNDQKLEAMAEFYAARARGGVGLMITGGFSPNNAGTLYPFSSKLDSSVEMEFHKVVTRRVKESSVGKFYEYPEDAGAGCYRTLPMQDFVSDDEDEEEDYKAKICLQILHAGRYAAHPYGVSSTESKSPISPFAPRKLSDDEVQRTIQDFIQCAMYAQEAGYDGVEVMGSEGYFINQFLSPRTANPDHNLDDRLSLPLSIVRGIREACGEDFIIIYRISLTDLIEEGKMPWNEIVELAHRMDEEGNVSIFNAGIGWHESRVPTIATSVPRGAWSWTVDQLKKSLPKLQTPISAVNRINAPQTAEKILSNSSADLITMARPFLADELFPIKAYHGHAEYINTCIGCNQACLDHAFVGKTASCLVNPHACREMRFNFKNVDDSSNTISSNYKKKRIAVIGAGPAGLSFAVTASKLGHDVALFDKSDKIGGQFNIAKLIPGKEEFYETLRYFKKHLDLLNIHTQLNYDVNNDNMEEIVSSYDRIVLATGVTPRIPAIPGIGHDKIVSYYDILTGTFKDSGRTLGKKIAILGAGGIGFDVAEYVLKYKRSNENDTDRGDDARSIITANTSSLSPAESVDPNKFYQEWGVNVERHGEINIAAIAATQVAEEKDHVDIYLLQRKSGKLGATLGKTTGWIHRSTLKRHGVNMMPSCKYEKIDENGNLHLSIPDGDHKNKSSKIKSITLEVDNIILCTGQEPNRLLHDSLIEKYIQKGNNDEKNVYMIGGAFKAGELDAKCAMDMGMRLAYRIHEDQVDEKLLEDQPEFEEKLMKTLK